MYPRSRLGAIVPGPQPDGSALRILLLNWRDLHHPQAGGAEVWTHEVARRLVDRGHQVTVFSGRAEGTARSEVVDGVVIRRAGGQVTTRLHAKRWFRRAHGERIFDVVVEEINTIPYFARRWSRLPTVVLIHQLAREVWWHEAHRSVAWLGRLLEPWALRACRGPVIALSESTRRDMLALGFPSQSAVVAMTGIDISDDGGAAAERDPNRIVYVGRIAPSKRVGDLVRALAIVRRSVPQAHLVVVGRGSEREEGRLRRTTLALGVSDAVELRGYVAADEKRRLLESARLVAMCSVREGWGMAVTEANAVGTPAAVYRVPGLVDSTRHDQTGLVTDPNPEALSAAIVRLMTDQSLFDRLSAGASAWARELTWEATTDRVEQALLAAVPQSGGARSVSSPEIS